MMARVAFLNIKLRSVFYLIFLIFSFFPYISFFPIGSDMQPYAVLAAAIIFFIVRPSLNLYLLLLLAVFSSSIVILLFDGVSFISMRSVFNYLSLFLVSYVSFKVLKSERVNFELFLKITLWIWIAVGVVQQFYDRRFLSFLLAASRTTEDRGVTGLAVEPTFYGLVLVFYILFFVGLKVRALNAYVLLCVFGVVFLAQSSMAVLYLLLMMALYVVLYVRLRYIYMLVIVALLYPFVFDGVGSESRLQKLILMLIDDPLSVVMLDASVNDRVFHVILSFKGFIDNNFFPNGFSSWNNYAFEQFEGYSDYIIVEWFSLGGRIMSGYGAAFFELGLFAIIIPVVVVSLLFSVYKTDVRCFYFHAIFVNLLMISAIPIGFAYFCLYLGFLLWRSNRVARACSVNKDAMRTSKDECRVGLNVCS